MGNTPNIRFKGFTDDWEQRKLGETLKYEQPGAYIVDSTDYDDSYETPVLTAGQSFILGYTNETNGIKNASPDNPVIIFDDFTTSSHFVDFPFKVKSSAMKLLTLKDESDDIYCINNILKNVDYVPTSHERHWISIFSEFDVTIPHSKDEQKKIGDYFRNLDHLITLHQRKCDETKKLKKFMLQKMFPKKDEKKPEIRFAGFTDDWEQRKLGDIFEQTSNLVNPKVDDIELWSLTVEDGLIKKSDRYNREFLVKKDDNFKEVRPGDIVYNPMNMTLGAVGYNGMEKSVAVSGYYTTMVTKDNYDSYYINTWLKSPQAILLYRTYATGSLIEKQRVQFPTLSIIPVAFPKYEEQVKIGNCFKSIDHLITLHQRKCDELKEFKKYMLQNMFPQKG